MTICLPDSDTSPDNPSSAIAMKYGCQFIAMCFQDRNSDLKYYNSYFNNAGSAFVLKPESLRYVPVTVAVPEEAPEKAEFVKIRFKNGDMIAINDEKLEEHELLEKLNQIGGSHGIGRLDLVEGRFIGMKSRGVYETLSLIHI